MKRQTKVRTAGWILGIFLGFLKWQYPEESYMITSNIGGLLTLILAAYLILYTEPKKSANK